MAQWGVNDAASNSVLWAAQQVKVTANSDNQTALYENVTPDAFISGVTTGQFAVDSTEVGVGSGGVIQLIITNAGSGYAANAAVTISGGGGSSATANAEANSTGRIATLNISAAGSSYETNPTVTVAAPAAITFNANTALFEDVTFYSNTTGVANTTEFITTVSAHGLSDGDKLQYIVPAGNTAVSGLTNGNSYYVISSNTTAFKLSTTSGGSAVDLTSDTNDETHTLRRQDFIEIATNVIQTNDPVTYLVAAGNTAITELANNTVYYAVDANSTGTYIATAAGGARLSLTPGESETGHSFTGETATGVAVVGGADNKGVAHTGWILRTVGSGGRAGRVHNEVLVAGGITGDSDDSVLPDA